MTLADQRLDAQIAEIASAAGALNLANARLVATMADVLTDDAWSGPGLRSAAQWLSYRAGVTTSRARTIIHVARRRAEFPRVIARFDAGELSLEQVAELVRAPAWADAKIEEWGTIATPARIRKSIKLQFGPDDTNSAASDSDGRDDAERDAGDACGDGGDHDRERSDWVTTTVTDRHRWRIHGEFDLADGSTIGQALLNAREALWERGQRSITVADCLREVAESYLDKITSPVRRDRNKVWLHLDAKSGESITTTGVRMPDSVRDRVCCDAIIQPVWETDGVPFSVGRSQRIVPERTRRLILLRDQGCRVPGCSHDRILEVHHVIHWLDDGPTDTWNLVALCPVHHRMHHEGRLGITGNSDEPGGLVFTGQHGRRLEPCGAPTPPTELPEPLNGYAPPLMGRVDWDWVGIGWIPPRESVD